MRIFQTAVLLSLIILASSVFAQDENRASKTWEVQKYDITATLPPTESDRYLTVKAVLTLKNASSGPGSQLTLRISDKAEVASVNANGATADFTKREEKIDANRILQRTVIRLSPVAPGQAVSVEVNYKLKVDVNDGLGTLSPVGSQFLPLSFWYPTPNSWYFARGADFAPFHLQVAGAGGQALVSSGTESAGVFDQKLNVQPFFITGNWDVVNAGGATVYLPKGVSADEQKRAGELASLLTEAKTFISSLLGTAPDVPLRIVAVRRGAGFSSGGTVLIDESVFRRQKIDSQTALMLADAMAKIWLGNAVKTEGDGFGVIREGLSRYIANLFLESKYGKDVADMERLRQRTAYAATARRDAPLNIASPIDGYYFSTTTNKGAMIWRLLAKKVGQDSFFEAVRTNLKNGNLSLAALRDAFPQHKEFLNYAFDQVTDLNLLVGLPQVNGGEIKVALRNTGSVEATVDIVATTDKGEKIKNTTTIAPKSFGETSFKPTGKIVRVEVDSEKLYPQTDYSDDIAPREIDDNDALLFVKSAFDKQDFAAAEKNARLVLQDTPRFDYVRVLLARALLAAGKTADAEREFRTALDEKLPTARTLAWANEGLGEVALKNNQPGAQAAKFFDEAIKSNGDYGATLAARQGKIKANAVNAADDSIKAFFAQFDKAAISNRKADLDAMIVAGELPGFSGGIAGQAQEWTSRVVEIEKINAGNAIVEVDLSIKMLNKSAESGTAVFRLTMIGGSWKLSGYEMFEVR